MEANYALNIKYCSCMIWSCRMFTFKFVGPRGQRVDR